VLKVKSLFSYLLVGGGLAWVSFGEKELGQTGSAGAMVGVGAGG